MTPPRLDAWRRVGVPVLTGMTAIAVLFVFWLARLPGWQP